MNLRDYIAAAQDRGLGDTVKRAADALKIKPCGGCEKRREALNRKFPYKKVEGTASK